ncbi:MAG: hypothetical protein HKP41_13890 [Desulfobacterales bacterium]|nr:hypothetical protein [Deltaproteobacteria bacterium]NNK95437.1 hypothetical protein [Desulfobacterales bacterium]
MGNPNDREFQIDVIKQTLHLLERPSGPLLEQYPYDAQETMSETDQLACPVNFTPCSEAKTDSEKLLQHFQTELNTMHTWFSIACERRGRTSSGVSGLSPDEIGTLFSDFISGADSGNVFAGKKRADLLRLAAEDLKACYLGGISAQPGQTTDIKTLSDWFWGQTYAALVINELRLKCLTYEEMDMLLAGKLLLIPRNQMHRFEAQ